MKGNPLCSHVTTAFSSDSAGAGEEASSPRTKKTGRVYFWCITPHHLTHRGHPSHLRRPCCSVARPRMPNGAGRTGAAPTGGNDGGGDDDGAGQGGEERPRSHPGESLPPATKKSSG